jgi:hypothetical protein
MRDKLILIAIGSWSKDRQHAGIAQLVEHDLAKVGVAGSSPVSRSDPGSCRVFFVKLFCKFVQSFLFLPGWWNW